MSVVVRVTHHSSLITHHFLHPPMPHAPLLMPSRAYTCHVFRLSLSEGSMMKVADSAELVLQTEIDAVVHDRGLLTSPRPNVDREKLQHHLREALRLLHVDLENENLRDTPRRWAESLVTLTS